MSGALALPIRNAGPPGISPPLRPVQRDVMSAPQAIERRPLLATALADWRTTQGDFRARDARGIPRAGLRADPGLRQCLVRLPLEFVAMYLLQGNHTLIQM